MKRVVYIVLLALLGFSCTRDPFEGSASINASKVSLSFEIPASELVVTYSAADDASRENAIARLDVFAFDQDGKIVSGAEGHLVLTNVNLVAGKGRTLVPVTIPAGTTSVQRRFGLVANAPNTKLMDDITTLSDLQNAEFTQTTLRTTHFVMSDVSALNTIDDAAPMINMSLRRAVSRVDVVLDDAISNFEITSVQLINVRDKGFVFGKNTDPNDLSSPIAIPAASSFVSYPKVDAVNDALKRNFSAQLYCPENYNGDKNDPAKTSSVIIGGIYNGATYYYRVNLHDNNRDAQVRRNYLYRVNIRKVNGVGNSDPVDAVDDAPQNLDYTVTEWDYSLHSDVVFDGKNYLGISQKKFSMPKGLGDGSINVVSNYADDKWTAEFCDDKGAPVAAPSWITLTKSSAKVNFTVTENTAPGAAPRMTHIRFSVPSNPRLVLISSIQQYHTDQSLISFEPQIISASWNATTGAFKSTATLLASGLTWTVVSLQLLEDKSKDWCRLGGGGVGVGSSNTTTSAGESFDLVFDVDEMSASLLARTAIVSVRVQDTSGFTEMRTVTLTQSSISNALSVGRLYIAKTAEIDVEKININTTGAWSADFRSGNPLAMSPGCAWLSFTDASYTALADPKKASGMGSGNIYVKFDACPANTVRDGYVVVTNGTQTQWIRIHQGDYRSVKINGYEMLDRNLGATYAPTDPKLAIVLATATGAHGYLYQWGRRPDGYEVYLPGTTAPYAAGSGSPGRVVRQPLNIDPAWGKPISPGNSATLSPADGQWLYPDPSLTPADQRTIGQLWDSRGVASNTDSLTNFTPVRTDYDPCPDGWRVPSVREMAAIMKTGAKQLQPINQQSVATNHGRFIATDNGRAVYFPTSNNRAYSRDGGNAFLSDGTLSYIGWYWTSSYSQTGSPYALRIVRSNIPDLLYTQTRKGLLPDVYPPTPHQTENLSGGHQMSVRCVRDRKIAEELSVSIRRKTVNMNAQSIAPKLTTSNLIGTWSASSDASWLTVSPATGSSDAELDIKVAQNGTPDVRQGEIRITTTSGTVVSVVVVQLDDSGILLTDLNKKKRWWRNRNMGATTGNFTALDDDNLGYFYGWGTKAPTRWTGSGTIIYAANELGWNLATGQIRTTNYPYPVKNIVNDPCPDGWRVPTVMELDDTYRGTMTSPANKGGWAYNRSFVAGDGKTYYLTAMGYRSGSSIAYSGQGGYYWSSFYGGGGTLALNWNNNNAAAILTLNVNYACAVRCIQEISDSFD